MEARSGEGLPHVLVLGGGFGGLKVCRELARAPCRVTLIDRRNHHLFQPLLYQVATAGLSGPDIASPFRGMFAAGEAVEVYQETILGVDLEGKRVRTDHREWGYDFLVIALGSMTSYFGNERWARHTLGLKSLNDAMNIRRRILDAFEEAEIAGSKGEDYRHLLTAGIVGGGPTGVELAGALAELKQHVFPGKFRHIDPQEFRIVLIEALDRLLLRYDSKQSAYTRERLEKMGVEVWLRSPVRDVSPGRVRCENRRLEAAHIIWTAGVEAVPLTRELGVEVDKAGRILVKSDLSLPGHPEVFAIGDLAKIMKEGREPVPGLASAAIQMGAHVARCLESRLRKKTTEAGDAFQYRNKGDMATIGRSSAIADLRGWKTQGMVAWLLWLVVHLLFLVGFRNRVMVLVNWIYAYFTFDRGARVVSRAEEERLD